MLIRLLAQATEASNMYLIYDRSDEFAALGIVFGSPFLVIGLILWSGITLPAACRKLLEWDFRWFISVHNVESRYAAGPGIVLFTGAGLLCWGVGSLFARVWWLHPLAWAMAVPVFACGLLLAATLVLYPFGFVPDWLRPKGQRGQVRGKPDANRAHLISLYVPAADREEFERTGRLPPKRPPPDPVDDWLRALGPTGEAALERLRKEREADDQ